ncbi:MBL fold metallo-hydrolase [Sphingobacterium lactis]|uniref:MBL fold metallo-hydrolase n=1 Tax=Sphingobacterium lactis TaxID=797291 RepID=UPI003F81B960
MNRRSLLKTGALLGVTGLLPIEKANAYVKDSKFKKNQPQPGFKRLLVGDAEVYVLTDGFIREPNVDGFSPRADIIELKKLLNQNFRSDQFIDMAMNVPLIKYKELLILIDCGMGIFADDNTGKLLESLSAAGFQPSDITDIFLSHAHPDHIGGIIGKNFNLIYPNAKFHISKVEKDFWMQASMKDFQNSALKNQPDFLNQFIPTVQKIFKAINSKLVFYEFDKILYDIFSFQKAPGHTPGMTLVNIKSKGQELLYVADLIHHDLILFSHPEWGFSGDTDLDLAVESRKKILQQLGTNRTKALAYHLAWPGIGFTSRDKEGFRWIPEVFFTT